MPETPLPHPVQSRVRAEELVRLRRPDEQRRYASAQRRGRIDANPHQVDAVIFALGRLPEGGCILADEVGLGKTIEAGLVIAQVIAEGTQRVLLILPKPLIGQWQTELFELFNIEVLADGETTAFAAPGVYAVGREFAGSERGSTLLAAAPAFELVVIDEAHEIFAGIYRRFDKSGNYRDDDELKTARMAHRVRQFLTPHTAVLLLTATPIQNTLTELWGLVQYVERTGTLLGEIGTFRELFCLPMSKDRMLVPEQADELRRRVNKVVQRTLRRQANDFLEHKFTERSARLFTYRMSAEERQLYDHVTDYLLEPHLCAFRGSQRQLLLIGFLRRMASSSAALRASLAGVARRLQGMLDGDHAKFAEISAEFANDLDDELELVDDDPGEIPGEARIRDELARVEGFIARCDALPTDTNAGCLLRAMAFILERGKSGKVVIFTESLKTQDYLREMLLGSDLGLSDGDITLFRGINESPRAAEAYATWEADVADRLPQKPDYSIGVRLALVHEFQHHSRVFISTEAGGKGLNLQFCDTIINYDLPWNPQRIEQRIGRCHRYKQLHDVTVINFLAEDNEAERRTYEILSEKLELFGTVLDASDVVLHESDNQAPEALVSALGPGLEAGLRQIHERARDREALGREIAALAEEMESRRDEFQTIQARTASLIESHLDEGVRQVFRKLADELPESLAALDHDIERVLLPYLEGCEARVTIKRQVRKRRVLLTFRDPLPVAEIAAGQVLAIGPAGDLEHVEQLSLGHPLLAAALSEARAGAAGICEVRIQSEAQSGCGRLIVTKVSYRGFEPVEKLILTGLLADGSPLDAESAIALLDCPMQDASDLGLPVSDADLEDLVEMQLFDDQIATEAREQERHQAMQRQIERYVEDRILVLRRLKAALERRLERVRKDWESARGSEKRTAAQVALSKVEAELESVHDDLARMQARDIDDFHKWQAQIDERRFQLPEFERLLDIRFVIEEVG